ncbi:protein of unknown function [Serratia sp. Tan611]|nr:protein of unknown function [Serratia sp. Tan611]
MYTRHVSAGRCGGGPYPAHCQGSAPFWGAAFLQHEIVGVNVRQTCIFLLRGLCGGQGQK